MSGLECIIVDGYNVLNSWEEVKKYKEDFEFARFKLVDKLCDYASFKGVKIVVVFDAHKQIGGVEKKEKHKSIEIVYTKEGEIADCYIEKMVYQYSKKYKVGVVTFDNLEQSLIMQMGAIRITPTEFLEQIKITNKKIGEKIELSYVDGRNMLENCIDKDILEKLEKIRRNL